MKKAKVLSVVILMLVCGWAYADMGCTQSASLVADVSITSSVGLMQYWPCLGGSVTGVVVNQTVSVQTQVQRVGPLVCVGPINCLPTPPATPPCTTPTIPCPQPTPPCNPTPPCTGPCPTPCNIITQASVTIGCTTGCGA